MNAFFLDAVQQYGYPVLWLIIFVAAAGIPLSGSVLLFASGAFAAFGDFNLLILFPVALSASVMGDNLTYYIGRRVGVSLLHWLGRQKRFRFLSPRAIEHAQLSFKKRAGWTIFTTRFLLVAFGGPINLVAGIEQYPYRQFLLWDVSGQILGVLIPLSLGYIFAQSWEEVAGIFGAISSLLIVLLIVLFLNIMLMRNIHLKRRGKQDKQETHLRREKVVPTQPILDTFGQIVDTSSASD